MTQEKTGSLGRLLLSSCLPQKNDRQTDIEKERDFTSPSPHISLSLFPQNKKLVRRSFLLLLFPCRCCSCDRDTRAQTSAGSQTHKQRDRSRERVAEEGRQIDPLCLADQWRENVISLRVLSTRASDGNGCSRREQQQESETETDRRTERTR